MPVYQGLAFLFVLSGVVFVHELGHFWVARWCGVKVLAFSIGFGRELFGFHDRRGTRWKICLIPLGGYVRMLGDADETSAKADTTQILTEEDRKCAFPTQPVLKRIAIVAAGPLSNILFAILVYAAVFMAIGQVETVPTVGRVMPGSAAEDAGLQPGDRFIDIDGTRILRFEQVRQMTQLALDRAMRIRVLRDGEEITVTILPRMVERTDRFGSVERTPMMGVVSSGEAVLVRHGPITALLSATRMTGGIVKDTFVALSQMIRGVRGADELGGPIRIAEVSAQAAAAGLLPLITMMAFLSVNLGLINILPIPLLDGGHLLFYAFEAVRGRPLPERVQTIGLKIGVGLISALMIFATWNDISRHIHRWLS
ncbi:MAG: RIP metalloprotease RseP [Rhodospirillaceae bacterium]|nr:RIP metalloprotease RseP [Rhodospirillaceae bacterium]